MKSAARVGLLLVVFVVLLVAGFGVLGESLFARVDTYKVTLSDAAGITPGTRVLMAGVKVGTVQAVNLQGPNGAVMTIGLKQGTPVPEGTTVLIPGSLIGLGDTPVNLVPPTTPGSMMAVGSTIQGHKAGPLDGLIPGGGKDTVAELTKTMHAVRLLLEDQKLKDNIQTLLKTTNQTMVTSQATMKSFSALADRGTAMLDRNSSTLDAMILETRQTLTEVHQTATAIAKFAKEGKLQEGAVALMEKANKIAEQSSKLLASFDKTLNDPELQASLHALATNAAETTKRGPAIADNAQKITGNMVAITESSKEIPGKLVEVMDKASKLEDRLGDLIDKVTGVLGRKPSAGSLANLSTEMDLIRQSHPSRWRKDIGARIPLSDGYLDMGIYDAFEGNKLTVQVGKPISTNFSYRYGVYASKPGMGVDFRISPKLSLRNDVWDINSPRFDSRLKYEFGNGLVGWIGADRIFRENAFAIGIGIKR